MIVIKNTKDSQFHWRILANGPKQQDLGGSETYTRKEKAKQGAHAAVITIAPDVAEIVKQELRTMFISGEPIRLQEVITAIDSIDWQNAVPVYGVASLQDETDTD